MAKAPRCFKYSYIIPNNQRHIADAKAIARRRCALNMADELIAKEMQVTQQEFVQEHSLLLYVLTPNELQMLIEDRIAKGQQGYPQYYE